MFNNNNEQLKGGSGEGFVLHTGLSQLQIVGINPTQEQLANIIGDGASKFNLDYSAKEYGRPITFWLKSPDGKVAPFAKTLFLKDEVVPVSQNTGKNMILNDSTGQYGTVQSTWATSPEELPEWFSPDGARAAKKGEYDWYDTIVKLLRFRDKEGGLTYKQFLAEEHLDFESIVNSEDNSVLHQFLEWLQDNGNDVFVGLLTVRESDAGKFYQDCELGNCMSANKSVTAAVVKRVNKINTPDYPVSRNHFTVNLQEFVKGDDKPQDVPVATKKKSSWVQ